MLWTMNWYLFFHEEIQPKKIKMSMVIVAIKDFQFVVCFGVYPNITAIL